MSHTFSASLFVLFFSITLHAQNATYLKVNEDSISLEEFRLQFANNIQEEGFEKAVDTYIDFQLLYDRAKELQVDTTTYYKKLYNQVSGEMLGSKLVDPTLVDSLVRATMQKQKQEHKLKIYTFSVQSPFTEAQEQQALAQANAMHQQVCMGKKVPKPINDTVQAMWFRSPHLPLEIESAAAKIKPGECSKVELSNNRYFFISHQGSRPTLGKVQFARIFTKNKEKIQTAHRELVNGKSFKDVALQFSEDTRVNENFGVQSAVDYYIPDAYYKEFSSLKPGEFSEPFQFGDDWYIVRLLQKKPCDLEDDCYQTTKQNLLKSSHTEIFQDYTLKQALRNVPYELHHPAKQEVIEAFRKNVANRNPPAFTQEKPVLSFPGSHISQATLYQNLTSVLSTWSDNAQLQAFIDAYIPFWTEQMILQEYESNLVAYNPEYREELETFGRALMVNYVMETEITQKAAQDQQGLQSWLQQNASRFQHPIRYRVEIYRYQGQSLGSEIEKALKKGENFEEIRERFQNENTGEQPQFIAASGLIQAGHHEFPTDFNFNKELQNITYRGMPAWVVVREKLQPTTMSVEEAGEDLVADYSVQVHQKLLQELRQRAQIQRPGTFRQ
ncbi:MAG: peptidylprolyl isomerase [Weeksellaceae bacterium]|nr:peptidylprolyl isomerase [Weeksellaceae bacterium]